MPGTRCEVGSWRPVRWLDMSSYSLAADVAYSAPGRGLTASVLEAHRVHEACRMGRT
jgi:hypothetical protein